MVIDIGNDDILEMTRIVAMKKIAATSLVFVDPIAVFVISNYHDFVYMRKSGILGRALYITINLDRQFCL